ncbi:uncharacterized protein [Nicotiana sylvestris]|uniref:uncharacterized protein n=1 Tax=Nicotiana sylvestris TaxID=4096 RepID=UPI00388C7914
MVPPLPPSSFPVEGTLRDTSVQPSFSPSVKGTLRDVQDQGLPKSSGVSSDHVPTEIGSTGAGETKPVGARSTFEEAHQLCSMLQIKIEDLEHLWGEVGQAKYEYNELRAQIDAHIAAKKNALAKVSALEVKLQNAHENSSVQTSRIARLESDLLEMKAEAVDARAEAEEIRAKADKEVSVYLKDAADVRAKLRGASDRERKSNEYAWYKSHKETLEEIHARGFDLSEEIEQAKADEYDAKFLVSNAEDNEGEVDGAAVPEGRVD